MLDRIGLSIRNGWLDEQNRVFIYFTLEEAMDAMGCGHNKAVAFFTKLDKVGLIERKKRSHRKIDHLRRLIGLIRYGYIVRF